MDALDLTRTVERLNAERVKATHGKPWQTLALTRVKRKGKWSYEFKYDLGKALADPEFVGFCDGQTTVEKLRQMVAEAEG